MSGAKLVRKMGANRIHLAEVGDDLLVPATIFGAPCEVVADPVVAVCRAVLRGTVVKMRDDQPVTCPTCKRFGALDSETDHLRGSG